jgi:hypothetical protein
MNQFLEGINQKWLPGSSYLGLQQSNSDFQFFSEVGIVRCIFVYVYFPHLLGGSCIFSLVHVTICSDLWPSGNTTCLFLTWYQSNRFNSSPLLAAAAAAPGRRRRLSLAAGELLLRPARPALLDLLDLLRHRIARFRPSSSSAAGYRRPVPRHLPGLGIAAKQHPIAPV